MRKVTLTIYEDGDTLPTEINSEEYILIEQDNTFIYLKNGNINYLTLKESTEDQKKDDEVDDVHDYITIDDVKALIEKCNFATKEEVREIDTRLTKEVKFLRNRKVVVTYETLEDEDEEKEVPEVLDEESPDYVLTEDPQVVDI